MPQAAMTGAMRWPRPVPMLWWTADYTDIRERCRRDQRLDRDEVWLPDSGDSFSAFCGRHGTYGFDLDWREWDELSQARTSAANKRDLERLRTAVRDEQERWEAAQRERQFQHDREWQAAEAARQRQAEAARHNAIVAARNAAQSVCEIRTTRNWIIDNLRLEAGRTYLVPLAIKLMMEQAEKNGW